MIQTKFLSIAIGMLQGMNQEDPSKVVTEMTAERLFEALEKLNDQYQPKVTEEEVTSEGTVSIEVENENGDPIHAQVKMFKLLDGETLENFNRVNGKITFTRRYTNGDGKYTGRLSAGRYVVEISKGSEYEIITDDFEVSEKTVYKKYTLKRFINLEDKGWYAGDIHHHSIYSSPVYGGDDDVIESATEVADSMMAMGLTWGALSDHHNTYNHEDWSQTKKDHFLPIVSKEISTSNGHVIQLGVDEDVVYRIPKDEDRTEEYLRKEFYRIVRQIKDCGGVAQLNHPRDLQRAISWNPNMMDMIDIFETVEIWNGSNPFEAGTTNDLAYIMWKDLIKQHRYIPFTTGSDTHNIRADQYHKFYDELVALYKVIEDHKTEHAEYKDEIEVFEQIFEKVIPLLEKWAETNLTSGGVRTYTYVEGEITKEKVLEALRRGHSFLTDGPIIIPKIQNKVPGSHIPMDVRRGIVDVDVELLTNRKLTKLTFYTENGPVLAEDLTLDEMELGTHRNYTKKYKVNVGDASYLYMIAEDDCTNKAITNPFVLDPANLKIR